MSGDGVTKRVSCDPGMKGSCVLGVTVAAFVFAAKWVYYFKIFYWSVYIHLVAFKPIVLCTRKTGFLSLNTLDTLHVWTFVAWVNLSNSFKDILVETNLFN